MASRLIAVPGVSKKILERKYEHIFRGFHELDFPFHEIGETFSDIKETLKGQLSEVNEKIDQFQDKHDHHNRTYISALNTIKENLLFVENKVNALTEGVDVFRKTDSDKLPVRLKMRYPYGECIRVCAQYAEVNDLLFRVKNRFSQFGPDQPYYMEAVSNQEVEKLDFRDYLVLLERQDYITAFSKVLVESTGSDRWMLKKAKNNNYQFTDRTVLLKTITKKMMLPLRFQTPRYKYHLEEDLLYHDVVLFPTMKSISIEDFRKTRTHNLFFLGLIKDSQFGDEFDLTAGDYFYHDVKHTVDMISQNWVAYLEQGLSFSESHNLFLKVRKDLEENLEKQIASLNLSDVTEIKRAINVTLFELNHEEGYPYDYNAMIRALESPNPFYGQKIIDFLMEKLTILYFFFPENSIPEEIFQFPLAMLKIAEQVILSALYECREQAKTRGYRDNSNTGYWEITRGKTQINPYQMLSGEEDYNMANKGIGNISLVFKPSPKMQEDDNDTANTDDDGQNQPKKTGPPSY